MQASYDAVVVGAGAFGAWIAHRLHRSGLRVLLAEAYGAGNSRASSGGESRILRCGYGDLIYGQWAKESLAEWRALSDRAEKPLFHQTGVLRFSRAGDPLITSTVRTLEQIGVRHEVLQGAALGARFPQFFADGSADTGVYEPQSGAMLARRSVQALVAELAESGVELLAEAVAGPARARGRIDSVVTASGRRIGAAEFVFACGPWLPKLFPQELGTRIFPTRQEVFFFGTKPEGPRFLGADTPCWVDVGDLYGVPDLENRGVKIGIDDHGPAFDPDSGDRVVAAETVEAMRAVLAKRLPALKDAPVLETRVCQYENTANGDFLLDRHPEVENVWFAGGGSGHGFKHGPAVGRYMAGMIMGSGRAEPRFGYVGKGEVKNRGVY